MALSRLNTVQRRHVYRAARRRYVESLHLEMSRQERVDWVVNQATEDCRSVIVGILVTLAAKVIANLVWKWIEENYLEPDIPEEMPEGFGCDADDLAGD